MPLAMLSAAFTASIAGANAPAVVSAGAQRAATTLPDGTAVPTQAIEAPASVSGSTGLGLAGGDATRIVSTASTSGIPSAALSAYQRAETVINSADKSCNLTWQLIAAIGRVESNHGRANGNVLDDNGLATPGIYGIALNGSNKTAEILDTDAGQYDNDTTYDRAVGPMQFIPSTWSVVGVDADGDGVRNPQDIDDAALGTAVYLCSGSDDLGTAAGQQAAVFRYNHSQSYVDLVLSIAEAYTLGDFTSMPNSVSAAGFIVRDPEPVQQGGNQGEEQPEFQEPPADTTTEDPTEEPTTDAPADDPDPVDPPTVLPPVSLPPLPSTSVEPVDQVLTEAQAIAQCLADGLSQVDLVKFTQCVTDYMTPDKKAADKQAADKQAGGQTRRATDLPSGV